MAIGTGTHFNSPVLGARDLYEDVPIDILSRTQRSGYFVDFIEPSTDSTSGIMSSTAITAVTTSAVQTSATGQLASNGVYRIANTVDAQGCGSLQAVGTAANFAPAQNMLGGINAVMLDGSTTSVTSFGARVRIANYDISDWFIGLAGIDTTLLLATGLLATTGFDNGVGFHHMNHTGPQGGLSGSDGNAVRFVQAGQGIANYVATLNTSSSATVPITLPADAAVDNVWFEFGIRLIGTTKCEWYINRTLRHKATLANAFAASSGLVPSFGFVTNGTVNNMDIDYFWVSQTRR